MVKRFIVSQILFFLSMIWILFFSACKGNGNQNIPRDARSRATPVDVIVIKERPFQAFFNVSGNLLPNEEVELRSEIAGKLTGIFFEEGQQVNKGMRLAKIFDQDLQAQLSKIEAQLELALEDEKRKQSLFEQQLASKEDVENTRSRRKVLEAERNLIRTQINRTEIMAPFDGIISLRHVSPGAYVTSNITIATLIQMNPIKIDFQFPDRYQTLIKTGSSIRFRQTGSPHPYLAVIYAIDPKADPSTRMIRARAKTANPQLTLKPGTMVQIEIPLETIPHAVLIPAEALIPELSSQKVFLYTKGIVASARVKTGLRTETEIQIIEGVMSGDTVITTGLLQIREGMPVSIRSVK